MVDPSSPPGCLRFTEWRNELCETSSGNVRLRGCGPWISGAQKGVWVEEKGGLGA